MLASEIKRCPFFFFSCPKVARCVVFTAFSEYWIVADAPAHPETRLGRRVSLAPYQPARYQMFKRRMMQFRSRIPLCFSPRGPLMFPVQGGKKRFINVALTYGDGERSR